MSENVRIKVVAGACRGRVLVVPATGATVGRGEQAEIRLDEPTISRQHCCIYRYRKDWLVQDLDSQNGTFVNGLKVQKERLKPGDSIEIGDAVLRMPRAVPVKAILTAVVGIVLLATLLLWLLTRAASAPPADAKDQKPASQPEDPIHMHPLYRHNPGLPD